MTSIWLSQNHTKVDSLWKLLKKDLLGLCSSNAILPNYHEYYHNLSTGNLIGDDFDNINSDLDQDIADSDNE